MALTDLVSETDEQSCIMAGNGLEGGDNCGASAEVGGGGAAAVDEFWAGVDLASLGGRSHGRDGVASRGRLLGISTAREDGVAGTEAKGAVVESSATAADVG